MQTAGADINPIISKDMRLVEAELEKSCDSSVELVRSMASYLVRSGGKRLRPSVLLLSSGMCGLEEGRERITCSAALELTHIASLLHDDVVDGAELRRGRESCNTVWGNKCAVVVGDALVSRAFQLIVSCGGDMSLTKVYSNAVAKVAEGQMIEVMGKKKMMEMNENTCMGIITKKTASLIECCAVMGAILAREDTEALAGYGLNLGIAFQLADDALDYCSTTDRLGKDAGLDIESAKMTIPLLKSLSRASAGVQADFERKLRAAPKDEDISLIRRFVADYGGAEETLEAAKSYVMRAKESISFFPFGEYKKSLLMLADFAAERSH